MFSKHRLEALSDAIFAIAMTLLVLDLIPHAAGQPVGLREELAQNASAWVGFLLTFGIAAVFWSLQHRLFDLLEGIGSDAIVPTFIFLGLTSILPFSASMLGHHPRERLAFVLYFCNQFAIGLALTAKLEISRLSHHLRQGLQSRLLRIRLYTMNAITGCTLLGAFLLPPKRLWIVPCLLAFTIGIIRRLYANRLAKPAAEKGSES
jgi:uncharacterized membrane protein